MTENILCHVGDWLISQNTRMHFFIKLWKLFRKIQAIWTNKFVLNKRCNPNTNQTEWEKNTFTLVTWSSDCHKINTCRMKIVLIFAKSVADLRRSVYTVVLEGALVQQV